MTAHESADTYEFEMAQCWLDFRDAFALTLRAGEFADIASFDAALRDEIVRVNETVAVRLASAHDKSAKRLIRKAHDLAASVAEHLIRRAITTGDFRNLELILEEMDEPDLSDVTLN